MKKDYNILFNIKEKKDKSIYFLLPLILLLFFLFLIIFYFNTLHISYRNNLQETNLRTNNLINSESKNEKLEDVKNIKVILKYNNKKWIISEKDFIFPTNNHFILENNNKTIYNDNLWTKKDMLNILKNMQFSNKEIVDFSFKGIERIIENISQEIYTSPINATAKYNNNHFKIIKEQFGEKLDKKKLYNDLFNELSRNDFASINLSTIKLKPHFTYTDIEKSLTKQSEFSTYYEFSNSERKNNIKVASLALNGLEILPGETFSFNKCLGERTIDKGYQEANIILDGQFIKGLGGGICQVSSTLYNALLRANITINEYHQHSLPVRYVSPGFDAMVSWQNADLKFKNTSQYPIYIESIANGKYITFKIYGQTNPKNYLIKTRSEILSTILPGKDIIVPDIEGKYTDMIKYKGEFLRIKNGKNGYETKSYLDYYLNGVLVNSKLIRNNVYKAQNGLIYEGTLPLDKNIYENANC